MKNLFLLAFTMLLTLVAVDADAQTLYGYTRDYPYAMVKIDVTNTAAATRTGSVDVLATAGAFVNDTYYVIGMDDDFNTLVYTANTETGALTKKKNLGESAPLPVDMSYDYVDEKMYFVTNSVNSEGMSALWTMNLETYAMTKVQDNMGDAIRALAVNAQGEMYGMARSGKLYPVNKTTGKIGTAIGDTGHSPQLFTALGFDCATGKLYWSCYADSKVTLYEVNTADASVTDLGVIGSGKGLITVAIGAPYTPSAATAPARVDSLKVTAAADGALAATISWQNPTLMVNGDALTSITKVEVLRGEDTIATLTTAAPGAVMSFVDDKVPASGIHRYTVRAYNEIGASADRFVDAYVGHDLLAAPERVISALGAVMGLPALTNIVAWDSSRQGIHGGWVDTTKVVYDVIRVNDGKVIAKGTSNEYCFDENLADTLTRYIYKVIPSNVDGEGEGKESNYLVNGPAAKIPFVADFDKKADADLWTVLDVNGDGYEFIWHRYTVMDGKGMYIYQTHEYNYALDMIVTPPMEFQEGHKYQITVSCCNSFAPYPESFRLYSLAGYTTQGAVPVGEPVENINHPNEFRPYTFELTAEDDGIGAADEKFISFFGVCCTSNPSMQMFFVDKVTVEDITPSAINDVRTVTANEKKVYTLDGRRVSTSNKKPGMYIVGGKKIVLK